MFKELFTITLNQVGLFSGVKFFIGIFTINIGLFVINKIITITLFLP